MSASWRHLGALVAQYEKWLGEQIKASEDRNAEEIKTVEAKYIEELKVTEAKYTEQLEAAEKKNVELIEQKVKLAEELKQHQATLTKAIEAKEKYKEASLLNFREASKLQDDLFISRKETEGLEECVKELEETNVSILGRYKGATFKCFYIFWKHNYGADFNYLSGCMRQSKINRCPTHLEKEERAKVPASPKISLAVNQQIPQDPVGS
ncbi:uncharacterized protein LOC133824203 [Humulus lupulus]|uniref:uncharacterized protein LOC133824203 n=1 Tax=Humulus lupulus TaxID=3486 RepID=UPI002B40E2C8|nr:uncharacterized protein LOC133824203 [Humulus lupulus]